VSTNRRPTKFVVGAPDGPVLPITAYSARGSVHVGRGDAAAAAAVAAAAAAAVGFGWALAFGAGAGLALALAGACGGGGGRDFGGGVLPSIACKLTCGLRAVVFMAARGGAEEEAGAAADLPLGRSLSLGLAAAGGTAAAAAVTRFGAGGGGAGARSASTTHRIILATGSSPASVQPSGCVDNSSSSSKMTIDASRRPFILFLGE
jgi:hypothetical protein